MPHGYARAKFVGERMLTIATERTPLQSLTFRIGQISGDSVRGVWNETDSIPVLLKGCQELASIPTDWVPALTWTPADVVAQTIIEVCLATDGGSGTFHVANPNPTSWHSLVPFVQENLVTRDHRALEPVTMREWIRRLKDCEQSADDNPAIKLIAFFENALKGKGVRCQLGLEKTKKASAALRTVPALDSIGLQLYLDYWQKIHFLRA